MADVQETGSVVIGPTQAVPSGHVPDPMKEIKVHYDPWFEKTNKTKTNKQQQTHKHTHK